MSRVMLKELQWGIQDKSLFLLSRYDYLSVDISQGKRNKFFQFSSFQMQYCQHLRSKGVFFGFNKKYFWHRVVLYLPKVT